MKQDIHFVYGKRSQICSEKDDREFYRQQIQQVLEDYHLSMPASVIYGALKTRDVKIGFFDTAVTLSLMLENQEVRMFCDTKRKPNSPMKQTYSLKKY